AGASAVGFIFWPKSPRFIDPYRAARIVSTLPAFVTPVGVFVNQPIDYVSGVASLVKLGAVQLHGDETPDAAARIAYPIVRAITIGSAPRATDVETWPSAVTLLLDSADEERRGGTGRTIDWDAAAGVAARRRVL